MFHGLLWCNRIFIVYKYIVVHISFSAVGSVPDSGLVQVKCVGVSAGTVKISKVPSASLWRTNQRVTLNVNH